MRSGRIRRARALSIAGLALAILASLAPGAGASSVSFRGDAAYAPPGTVRFEAAAGESNALVVRRSGDALIFEDPGAPIHSADCAVPDPHTAVCTADPGVPFSAVFVTLGDGDDSASCSVTRPFDGEWLELDVDAGTGDDAVTGCDTAAGADRLDGGPGADELRGRAGDDAFLNVRGPDGDDAYDGGAGFDWIAYELAGAPAGVPADAPGAVVGLDARAPSAGNGLPGESDTLTAIEDVAGSSGADRLTGSAGGNVLDAGAGDDTVTGGAGPDNLSGGPGADAIDARDGGTDRVACGGQPGDTATVDDVDERSDDCPPEGGGTTVSHAPPPPGPIVIRDLRDTVRAVILSVSAARRVPTSRLRRTGAYVVRLRVNEPVTAEVSLSARLRGGRIASGGRVTLADARRGLAANEPRAIRLRIPRRTRKVLRRGRTLRLSIELRDAGNNLTTRRLAVRLT